MTGFQAVNSQPANSTQNAFAPARPQSRPSFVEHFGLGQANLALFILFACYGPSVSILGEFRLVELAVLLLMVIFYPVVTPYLKGRTGVFVSLFFYAAIAQYVSDVYNESDFTGTAKRVGTFIILGVLLLGLRWLVRDNPQRLRWLVLGYSASYGFILVTGLAAIELYYEAPWRLGLGFAVTVALCVFASWNRHGAFWGGIGLLIMALIHLAANGRALGLFTGLAGALSILAYMRGNLIPPKITVRQALLTFFGVAAFIASMVPVLYGVVALKVLPDEVQTKMEMQLDSPYGLLAAARPDTITALYAISKRPFAGYGSTGFDLDVFGMYIEIASSAYFGQDNYDALKSNAYENDDLQGIPSHSHLFGAWADAGFLASLCWWFTLALAATVFMRSIRWNNPLTPLYLLISLNTFWDILFSPGPHRMDIAIRIVIMLYATAHLATLDRFAKRQEAERQGQLAHG